MVGSFLLSFYERRVGRVVRLETRGEEVRGRRGRRREVGRGEDVGGRGVAKREERGGVGRRGRGGIGRGLG